MVALDCRSFFVCSLLGMVHPYVYALHPLPCLHLSFVPLWCPCYPCPLPRLAGILCSPLCPICLPLRRHLRVISVSHAPLGSPSMAFVRHSSLPPNLYGSMYKLKCEAFSTFLAARQTRCTLELWGNMRQKKKSHYSAVVALTL